MPRSTSPTLESLLPGCETQSTAKIVLRDGTELFLTTDTDEIELDGDPYVSGLLKVGELKETLGQPTNRINVQASNVDGELGLTVSAETRKTELSDIVVRRFYRSLDDPEVYEWKHFFTGKAVNVVADERQVSFDVIDDIEAAGTCIATETLSPNNGWKFPETPDQSPPGTPTNPGGGIGGGGCFLAGTIIYTPFGQKPIEAVKKGWKIYSFDADTRTVEADKVGEVFTYTVEGYYEFTFSDGTRLKVTPEHPFLSESEWVKADDLVLGRHLWRLTANEWQKVALEKIKWISESAAVFNIHVEKNQTYFANGIACHNKLSPFDIQ